MTESITEYPKSVSQIYQDAEVQAAFARKRPGASLGYCVAQLEGLEQAEDAIEWLDDIATPEERQLAVCAISGAAPEIAEVYGTPTLAWAWVNDRDKKLDLAEEAAAAGYDANRLTRARKWAEKRGTYRFPFVRAQYDFCEAAPNFIEQIPLDELLQNHPATKTHGVKHLAQYSLQAYELSGDGRQGWLTADDEPFTDSVFTDGQVGALLRYRDIPQVVTSFNMSYPSEAMAYQLQRLSVMHPQSGRGWPRLDWPALLVDIAAQVATHAGADFLGIQSAQNNHWKTRPDFDMAKAQADYDGTASHLEFWEGADNNWHKRITSLPEGAQW